MILIGEIIILIGFTLLLIGVICQISFKSFYKRLLLSSIIDSASIILIFTGIIIRQGLTIFSFKVLVIMALMLLINPLASHKLGRSAYLSRLGDRQ